MKNCAAQTASNNQRCSFAILIDNPKTGERGWSTGYENREKKNSYDGSPTVFGQSTGCRTGTGDARSGADDADPGHGSLPAMTIGMRRKNGKGACPFPFCSGDRAVRRRPSSFHALPGGEAAYRPASSTRRRHISDLLRLYRWMPGAPQSSSCRIWRAAKRRPASRTASTPPSLWAASSSR